MVCAYLNCKMSRYTPKLLHLERWKSSFPPPSPNPKNNIWLGPLESATGVKWILRFPDRSLLLSKHFLPAVQKNQWNTIHKDCKYKLIALGYFFYYGKSYDFITIVGRVIIVRNVSWLLSVCVYNVAIAPGLVVLNSRAACDDWKWWFACRGNVICLAQARHWSAYSGTTKLLCIELVKLEFGNWFLKM